MSASSGGIATGGNVTYSAPRNADGHSDRAAALALVCEAAKATPSLPPVIGDAPADPDERAISW